jgi:glyoxylase-like metal-dependent hydrolase (beta-lactamase superfamily II)
LVDCSCAKTLTSILFQILTHEHDDHVGGLSALTEEFGEMPVTKVHQRCFSVHSPAGNMSVYKLSTTRDRACAPSGSIPLYDGQNLDLQGISLKVLETLHSFGHLLCF